MCLCTFCHSHPQLFCQSNTFRHTSKPVTVGSWLSFPVNMQRSMPSTHTSYAGNVAAQMVHFLLIQHSTYKHQNAKFIPFAHGMVPRQTFLTISNRENKPKACANSWALGGHWVRATATGPKQTTLTEWSEEGMHWTGQVRAGQSLVRWHFTWSQIWFP